MAEKNKAAPASRRFTIKMPNDTFTGERTGMAFFRGIGETDDVSKAEWCFNQSYKVFDGEASKPEEAMTGADFKAIAKK